MPKKTRRQPPSRIKYEQNHPTVTCRVSKEIYDELVKAREEAGKSFADFLRIGLGEQATQTEKHKLALETEYQDGWERGYNRAKEKYMVTYHCKKCGQIIEVKDSNEKQAIDKYMHEYGWEHSKCPQTRG